MHRGTGAWRGLLRSRAALRGSGRLGGAVLRCRCRLGGAVLRCRCRLGGAVGGAVR